MKKIFAGLVAAVGAICVVAVGGCNANNSKTVFCMNTPATLVVKGMSASRFDRLSSRVEDLLYSTENSISATKAGSSVCRFNLADAGTEVEIDKTCYDVLTVAMAVYELTEGAYNPAVWYCEDLYGFAPRAQSAPAMPYDRATTAILPEQKYIDAFKSLASHFDKVTLREDGGKYYAYKPSETVTVEGDQNVYSLRIDLGGVGKGWATDRVDELLQEYGAAYGYFDFGSSSLAVNAYDGNSSGEYTLQFRDPRKGYGASYLTYSLRDMCLSTSGDYEAYYVVDGVRYCHIIDPFTGSPIATGAAAVTVGGGLAAENDALTTALSVMDKQKAVEFINAKLSDRLVVMLYIDGESGEIITNRPQEITVNNPDYVLANTVSDGKIILN